MEEEMKENWRVNGDCECGGGLALGVGHTEVGGVLDVVGRRGHRVEREVGPKRSANARPESRRLRRGHSLRFDYQRKKKEMQAQKNKKKMKAARFVPRRTRVVLDLIHISTQRA
jgi:hypothetical protein